MYSIINDAAGAYKGIIPPDRWKVPYMSQDELRHEIREGVAFWGYIHDGELTGVMGIQPVQDITLIRHAYVRTEKRNQGMGGKLLDYLLKLITTPVLIGTWADAAWAVRFYEKYGFQLVSIEDKNRLLKKYWGIPERQVETSVVLADHRWLARSVKVYSQNDLTLRSDVTGAKMWAVALEKSMLSYFKLEPNMQFPEHAHEAEQITLVLEGQLTFAFEGKTVVLGKGDVIAIPSNASHSASTGNAPCMAVDAWSPVRKEYL